MEDLERQFSDRSRKVKRIGKQFLVPHKFTYPDGEVITEFDPKKDISRLSLSDFKLLASLQKHSWDISLAARETGLDLEKAKARYKRLSYFEFEEKRAAALAAIANAEFVTAQNVEGFYRDHLTDSQREHLKELAKITGAYKTAPTVAIQNNVFQMPEMSVEDQARLKALADDLAGKNHAA